MTFLGLACCLTLLAYGASICAGSPVVLALLRPALRTPDPDRRSRRLLALRLLPAVLATFIAGVVVLPSFLWLEPRSTGERLGPGLLLAAALSAAVLATGIARGSLGLLATRRLTRRWTRDAHRIRLNGVTIPAYTVDERFPVVTVAGCWRPRLFVSRAVLDCCTPEELAAIVAHETGHLRRGDPWKRLLLRFCPDILAVTPVGASIESRWEEAAEQAADDQAAADGAERCLDLASALLKVARIAASSAPPRVPLTALYRGGGVAARAARLLERTEPPAAIASRHRPAILASMALPAGALLVAIAAPLGLLPEVHRLLEAVVSLLG